MNPRKRDILKSSFCSHDNIDYPQHQLENYLTKREVLSLLALCGSLGSVSEEPAQWKTLLRLTRTRVLERNITEAPPLSEGCPRHWRNLHYVKLRKTRRRNTLHKICQTSIIRARYFSCVLFSYDSDRSNCRGSILCGWSRLVPYVILDITTLNCVGETF